MGYREVCCHELWWESTNSRGMLRQMCYLVVYVGTAGAPTMPSTERNMCGNVMKQVRIYVHCIFHACFPPNSFSSTLFYRFRDRNIQQFNTQKLWGVWNELPNEKSNSTALCFGGWLALWTFGYAAKHGNRLTRARNRPLGHGEERRLQMIEGSQRSTTWISRWKKKDPEMAHLHTDYSPKLKSTGN